VSKEFDIVTGGAGFIGSHLVRKLLSQGSRVRVVDDLSSGKRANLAAYAEEYGDAVDAVELSICDLPGLQRAFEGAQRVFHLAAIPSVPDSIADPIRTNDVNISGTLNVMLAARDAGARKLVMASSCAVYGNAEIDPGNPNRPVDPLSPYAISKRVGELYARNFADIYDLPTFCLRFYNVFGPRQDPASEYAAVIPRFITLALAGESPTIFGDGEQTRDFVYIENIVNANLMAAEADAKGMEADVGCGASTSLNQLVDMLGDILGRKIKPIYEPARAGEVRDSQADPSIAEQSIGFSAEISFFEGLRRTVAWYQAQHEGR
jgi:nucleoside-diphosphate-sugar epimerase